MKEKNNFSQHTRLRLMVAIPVLTTLLVLGAGWIILDLNQRELLFRNIPPTLQQINHTVGNMVIATVIAGIGALIAGIILALAVTYPFQELAEKSKKIAQGDLTTDINISGREGEFVQLADAFNQMVTALNKFLLQRLSGCVITIDREGKIMSSNMDTESFLGYTSDDIVSRNFVDTFVVNSDKEKVKYFIKNIINSKIPPAPQEISLTEKNGCTVAVSMLPSLLKTQNNTIVGITIQFEDIGEIRKIQEQIRKIDRLTTLGGLAAGVAHQVRNPLCSIKGITQLLQENMATDETTKNYTDVILKDVDKINGIIETLLRSLQPGSWEWQYENIDNLVKNTLMKAKENTLSQNPPQNS